MVSNPRIEIPTVGNYLFALCFVVSVFILVIGLTDIFSNTLTSLYLMLVAFVGAAVSSDEHVTITRSGEIQRVGCNIYLRRDQDKNETPNWNCLHRCCRDQLAH